MMAAISTGSLLDKKPDLAELTQHVDVGSDWHRLGVQLMLKPKKLDGIAQSKHDFSDKLLAMFQQWLESNPCATRRDVTEALRKIDHHTIAEQYEESLKIKNQHGGYERSTTASTFSYITSTRLEDKYMELNSKFGQLLINFVKSVMEKGILEDIKEYLLALHAGMSEEVDEVDGKRKLISLLRKYCYLSNFAMLQYLANSVQLDMEKELAEFTKERDELYEATLAEDFAKKAIEDHVTMENQQEMSFTVSSQIPDDTTLMEFQLFLTKAFHRHEIFISLKAVHKSLLTFVCTIPSWFVGEITAFVKKNEEFLKSQSLQVVKVSIGKKLLFGIKMAEEKFKILEVRTKTLGAQESDVRRALSSHFKIQRDVVAATISVRKYVDRYYRIMATHEIAQKILKGKGPKGWTFSESSLPDSSPYISAKITYSEQKIFNLQQSISMEKFIEDVKNTTYISRNFAITIEKVDRCFYYGHQPHTSLTPMVKVEITYDLDVSNKAANPTEASQCCFRGLLLKHFSDCWIVLTYNGVPYSLKGDNVAVLSE